MSYKKISETNFVINNSRNFCTSFLRTKDYFYSPVEVKRNVNVSSKTEQKTSKAAEM